MSIIRTPLAGTWSPFDRLAPWRDLLESAFAFTGSVPGVWTPPLDVYEDDEKVTVTVELAGLTKEDFDISLDGDALTISGQRKAATGEKRGESFRSERFFGSFSRTVTLPAAVKADGVTASYQNGLLAVSLPKAEEAKPRKIEVKLN
ncbi:MAG: Hsp20/alpha crystallin family protein [Terrimicrobiaceae bacterium]|nr:Hsp20/alpha crystallin family protein [Terrimicrobiaceae bacterium]